MTQYYDVRWPVDRSRTSLDAPLGDCSSFARTSMYKYEKRQSFSPSLAAGARTASPHRTGWRVGGRISEEELSHVCFDVPVDHRQGGQIERGVRAHQHEEAAGKRSSEEPWQLAEEQLPAIACVESNSWSSDSRISQRSRSQCPEYDAGRHNGEDPALDTAIAPSVARHYRPMGIP